MTLLHQHQRPRKTATINGKTVAYVETALADIEVAHRLAHAVLGQSLDELAPQTRRLLTAIDDYVTAEARRLAIPRDLTRFTRRQLREHLAAQGSGWGDTQLKVHLARLVDLELVIVHRLETGAFGYELLWNSTSTTHGYDAGGRFLTGLTDPKTLLADRPEASVYAYDGQPVGENTPLVGPWSGAGRPVVGPRSEPDSDPEDEADEGVDLLRRVVGGGR